MGGDPVQSPLDRWGHRWGNRNVTALGLVPVPVSQIGHRNAFSFGRGPGEGPLRGLLQLVADGPHVRAFFSGDPVLRLITTPLLVGLTGVTYST
jgi:hypothetical protein